MARPANDDNSDGDGIDLQARTLASRFDADVSRTAATIRRLIGELPSLQAHRDELSTSTVLDYATGFLRGAFLALAPSDALTLIESTPSDILEDRVSVSDYLAGAGDECGIPLYSRRELADRLAAFREFLTRDQQHLLKTGLPSGEFPDCPWLWTKLGCLYPVNRTDSQWPFDPPETFAGVRSAYRGVRITTAASGMGVTRTLCRLEEADLIYGLTAIDADTLSNMRARIFGLKLAVLEEGERHLRSPARSDLWNRCRSLLQNVGLTADEVDYCIQMDRIYTEVPDKWKQTSRFLTAMHGYDGSIQPGGFTGIVELIGHVEEECAIGTLHKTREALGDLLITNEVEDEGGQLLWASPPWSYFHIAANSEDQEILDRAIDVFRESDERAFAFWQEFDKRASTIADGLERTVAIQFQANNAIAELLGSEARTYIEFRKSHWSSIGTLLQLRVESSTLPPARESGQNEFRQNGDVWEIKFGEGPRNPYVQMDGLLYLAILVSKPEQGYLPMELYGAKNEFERISDGISVVPIGQVSPEHRETADVSSKAQNLTSNAGTRTDRQALAAYRERLKCIAEELEEAKAFNDQAKIIAAEEERDTINQELRDNTWFGGNLVVQSPEGKRAQDKVRNAIDRAIEKIREKDPPLAHHLEKSYESDPLFAYRPEKPTQWSV